MTVNPAPWVELDGIRVYCKGDRRSQGVTILDDLALDWGREHPMADRGTTTAQFNLWDADGYWLARAASATGIADNSPVLGVPVVIGWTVDDDTRIIFRGTVSNFDIRRSRRVDANTTARAWQIAVTATDRPTDLGTAKLPDDSVEFWPAESSILRANRLKAAILAAGVDINEVYFEPDTVSWPMSRTRVKDKTILQLLDEFYASFGLTWDYRAGENVTRPAPTPPTAVLLHFYRIPGTNDHVTGYGSETLTGFGADAATYYWATVRGCDVSAAAEAMTIDRADRTNTIRINYVGTDGEDNWTTGTWTGVTRPRWREMTTWLNLDGANHGNSSRAFTHQWDAIRSTNLPAMPRVTYDTRATHDGFIALENAYCLTRASQSWSKVVITGNPYAAALGRKSIFQIIGGTVRYVDGRWIVDMIPAWIANVTTVSTWSDADSNPLWPTLTWNDPSCRLDESMTWADLVGISPENSVPALEMH